MEHDYTHIVRYKNQGKPEKAYYESLQEAIEGADFLKFQGATSVKIYSLATGKVLSIH